MEDGNPPKTPSSGLGIKIAIVVVLLLAVAGAVVLKTARGPAANPASPVADTPRTPLPRMAEFGSDKCIPCKAMMPVLDALGKEYAGVLEVTFTDVAKDPEAGYRDKINIIPTQIFFDPAGKELFRHEGFFAKEDIVAKWKELGYELKAGSEGSQAQSAPTAPDAGNE